MGKEQRLGHATLGFYFLRNLFPGVVLFFGLLVILGLKDAVSAAILSGAGDFGVTAANADLAVSFIVVALMLLSAVSIAIGTLISIISYETFTYSVDEFDLKIRQGFLDHTEMAIPYRQIQDVDIDRPLPYRILGLSKLEILTAGNDSKEKGNYADGLFNAIDADRAEDLKAQLLKRAGVQFVQQIAPQEEIHTAIPEVPN